MTDLDKPKAPRKKKPPTQIAGVTGIDGHGAMGEAPIEPAAEFRQYIDWHKLTSLPAFEMFVLEESGQAVGSSASEWVIARRSSMGDDKLYDLYAKWHEKKGLWVDETPVGRLIKGIK